MEYYLIVST